VFHLCNCLLLYFPFLCGQVGLPKRCLGERGALHVLRHQAGEALLHLHAVSVFCFCFVLFVCFLFLLLLLFVLLILFIIVNYVFLLLFV